MTCRPVKCKTLVLKAFPKDFFGPIYSKPNIQTARDITNKAEDKSGNSVVTKKKLVLKNSKRYAMHSRNNSQLQLSEANTARPVRDREPQESEHEDSLLSHSKFIPAPPIINDAWTRPPSTFVPKQLPHQQKKAKGVKLVLPDVFTKKVSKAKGYFSAINRVEQCQRFSSYLISQEPQTDPSENSLPFKVGEGNGLRLSVSTESESRESVKVSNKMVEHIHNVHNKKY